MGLSDLLGRWATRCPHVLVVGVPGWAGVRYAVEDAIADLGGVLATSPADADVLVVAGRPGAELTDAVEAVWRQLPGPRARTQVETAADALPALTSAIAHLRDQAAQRQDATDRDDEWSSGEGSEHEDAGADEPDVNDDADMDGGDMDGGMDMEMPGGLMMADRAPDRDGLMLDVLHVPLGPVLPDWPAGLVVDLTLQGDLVAQASARWLPAAEHPAPLVDSRAWAGAAVCDDLARLLGVAGWSAESDRARAWRRVLLAGPRSAAEPDVPTTLADDVAAWCDRLRRSRTLRWATEGLGRIDGADVHDRLVGWLDNVVRSVGASNTDPTGPTSAESGLATATGGVVELTTATSAVVGLDLAAARLVLASLPLESGRVPEPEPLPWS